jgi:hypothetical protein
MANESKQKEGQLDKRVQELNKQNDELAGTTIIN